MIKDNDQRDDKSLRNKDNLSWRPYLASALDNHAIFAVMNAAGAISYVNDRMCEISKFGRDEWIGNSYRLIASGCHSKSFIEAISQVIKSGGTWRGEVQHRAKDGLHYWVDATITPFAGSTGAIAGYMVVETEITKHKRSKSLLRSNLNLLKAIFEYFPGGLSYISNELVLESANSMFYKLLDLPEDMLAVGCRYEDIIRFNAERGDYGDGDPEVMIRDRVELARKFEKHAFERKRPDGTCLEIRGFPLPEGGFVSTYVDVTERKKVEATNTLLARIVEDSMNEVYVFDAENLNFIQVNNAACTNLGYTREELMDMTPVDLKPEFTLGDFENVIAPLRSGENAHVRFEATHLRKDKSLYTAQITLQLVSSDDRPVFAAIIEDITEKRNNEMQIVHMAHHDALTDLPNRTLLRARLEEALARTKRTGKFAVLCLDLDRFKTINDSFGHAVGDKLLRSVAKRLRACIRASDTVARLGGDEFAIIQCPSDLPHDATSIAKRICKAIEPPFDIDGRQIVVDTSIGIAVAPEDGTCPDKLLHHADMAMYRAKADGGGTYHFFEPELDARMQERQKLEMDLLKGLDNNEFEVWYQPIINLEHNRITSFEALLRWNHPERGMISPAEFIPIAEDSGFIRPLGKWVLRKACQDAVNWPEDIKVAVNLSPIQFKNQNLALMVTSALAVTNFPATRLELEITESVLMHDTDDILLNLHQLRNLGVQISMDDFGSGYSSLGYLRSFPFDKIKIDRSFIKDISDKQDAVAIVQVIATLGARLGISTLAEGVETTEQRAIVCAEGCTEMQGFLFSPPKPLDEIMRRFFPDRSRQNSVS